MLKQYADKFKIERDEIGDPLIQCAGGFVYEYSAVAFGVWINSQKPMRTFKAIQRRWPTARSSQVGEGEFTFIFTPRDRAEAERFLRFMKAHRRREYGETVKAKMKEQAAKARASKALAIA